MDNGSTELLGQVHVNRLVIAGEAEKGTCPSWQGDQMPHGMEGVCSMVVAIHNPMGLGI